jgi:hypothetical protein
MRLGAVLAATTLLAISCGQGSAPTASHTASTARTSGTASPAASPSPVPQGASYGLLLSAGTLEMITPNGELAASATVAAPTVQICAPGLGALLQPPVSATADKVYFRDGDTRIRYLTPTGLTGDATTVPGDGSSVSFFSVSPDDQRIAVLVEDLTSSVTIGLRLYVEDLNGHGNHVEIYSATTSHSTEGNTLWPMGWHQGQLVLAVMAACTNDPATASPSEWHVASAVTGNRVATIKGSCILSRWPSAAGVACLDQNNLTAAVYDWTGKLTITTPAPRPTSLNPWQSGLSPSGQRIFFANSGEICTSVCPVFQTDVNSSFMQGGTTFATQFDVSPACLWIDETHLMSPNGVVSLQQSGSDPIVTANTKLAASGQCAGRYPGGL